MGFCGGIRYYSPCLGSMLVSKALEDVEAWCTALRVQSCGADGWGVEAVRWVAGEMANSST